MSPLRGAGLCRADTASLHPSYAPRTQHHSTNSYIPFKAQVLLSPPPYDPPSPHISLRDLELCLDQRTGRLLTAIEGHPLVGLLGAWYRVAIVQGTLEISEGHGTWGTVLGTEMGVSEAGTASEEPREAGKGANIFGGMRAGSRGAFRGTLEGLGAGWNLPAIDRGGTREGPPSTALPPETCAEQGGHLAVRASKNPRPRARARANPTHIPAGSTGLKVTACVGRQRVWPGAGLG